MATHVDLRRGKRHQCGGKGEVDLSGILMEIMYEVESPEGGTGEQVFQTF